MTLDDDDDDPDQTKSGRMTSTVKERNRVDLKIFYILTKNNFPPVSFNRVLLSNMCQSWAVWKCWNKPYKRRYGSKMV